MISPETDKDILADISRNLDRIAAALEAFNNAAIRGFKFEESDGYVVVVTESRR